jgi:hypothetical protein
MMATQPEHTRHNIKDIMETNNKSIITMRVGFYSSLSLAILTLITFGFAMIAVPPAGPYCPGDCMSYPYPDILSYYPRDYYWMYMAVLQLLVYLIFIISNHFNVLLERRIFSFISVAFALISTSVLLADYFLQFAVVPISVMKGETEGIALITQYNGRGVFVVLEELGYLLMSISFLFLGLAFAVKNRLERTIRWILIVPIVLTVFSFVFYSIKFGIDRNYRFEVAAITINWLVIIVTGILISIYFKREIKLVNKKLGQTGIID